MIEQYNLDSRYCTNTSTFSAWIEIPTRFNSRDNDGCAASMIRVSLFFS